MDICAFHEELISEYVRFSRSFAEFAWQTSSRPPIRLTQAGVSTPPHSIQCAGESRKGEGRRHGAFRRKGTPLGTKE